MCPEDKISINTIKECLSRLEELEYNHIILVYNGKLTSCANNVVKTIENTKESDNLIKKTFEVFNKDELQLNITKHHLASKHEVVEKKELDELKSKLDILKLPVILKIDPMCKFYNFQIGDIIKITRRNGFIAYRRCISE